VEKRDSIIGRIVRCIRILREKRSFKSLPLSSDRRYERLDAEDVDNALHDVDNALHIVGQHLQTHLCLHVFERLGQEVCAPHPSFERSEGMLDGLPLDYHGKLSDGRQAPDTQ
jgi:hypothetical protein